MAGPGGAASAPPAINDQGRWQSLRFVINWRRTTKHLLAGFMTSFMKGFMMQVPSVRAGSTLVAGWAVRRTTCQVKGFMMQS
jgi:hypothetical protein